MTQEYLAKVWDSFFRQLVKDGKLEGLSEEVLNINPSSEYDSSGEDATYEPDEEQKERVRKIVERYAPVEEKNKT